MMKAFVVYVRGWPEVTGIVAASYLSQAKYASLKNALEANFNKLSIRDFSARRAPIFDRLMSRQKPGTCWSLEYAVSMLSSPVRTQPAP